MRARLLLGALALKFFFPVAVAQPATEGEAHILSAFTSRADPRALAPGVRLGPALREALGAEADGRAVYEALVARTMGRALRVQQLAPQEAARYAALVGRLADPLVLLQAGELALLMQYAAAEKHVSFVEQLSGPPVAPTVQLPPQPPPPAPRAQKPAAEEPQPPPAAQAPKPPAPAAEPPVLRLPRPALMEAPRAAPRPRGECIIKPVMTDEDLYNCGAVPR